MITSQGVSVIFSWEMNFARLKDVSILSFWRREVNRTKQTPTNNAVLYFDSSNNMTMDHKVEAAAWLGATNGPENVITQPLMRLEV